MKKLLFSILIGLSMVFSGYGGSTMTPDATVLVSKEELSSTNSGSEGIRDIGAFGGYTLDNFIKDTAVRGPARDLPKFVYNTTNLIVTYSDGDIYDPENGYFHLDPGTKPLTDNAVNYAYWSTNDPRIIQWTTVRPDALTTVYLGTFGTSMGKIIHATTAVAVGDELLYEDLAFANIFPSLVVNGLNAYPTGTGLTNIIIGSGIEYHDMAERNEHQPFNFNTSNKLVIYTHTLTNWTTITTNLFPVGMWDDGTNLVACNAANWYRGVFVSANNGIGQLTWIAPDYEYTNETDAIAGSDPDLPPGFVPYIPKSTAYVFKGDDTELRDNTTYWVDRRNSDNLLKGSSVSSGSGGNTPTLLQVLLAGPGTGGILPSGMGDPTTDDQAASKGYVDSTRNKASTGTGYVDPINGDDLTGRPEKASLPYKTIQAAIDGCAAVSSDSKRFLVTASVGSYTGNVIMAKNVSLRGMDIEATIIYGQVTIPSTYDDITGTELQVLTVRMTNAPALVVNAGVDDAYFGVRSCGLYSTYDEDKAVKSVIEISRGNVEIYATTWIELDVEDVAAQRPATLYYLTTDPANSGSYRVNTFSSSHILNILDTNDTVSIVFCNATVAGGFFASKSDATHIALNDDTNHANRVTALVHKNASGVRSFVESSIIEVELSLTNNCDVIGVSSTGSTSSAVAHFNNSRIIVPNVNDNALFYGSAATTGDVVEVINSQIGAQSGAYPERYTEAGSSGRIAYVVQHASGDIITGGAIDMSASVPSIIPESGHVKLYAYTYAGLENPMFIDSSTNKIRLARDHFFNGYNSETTTLRVGEAVHVVTNLSSLATPIVIRSISSDPTTMPCDGIVVQVGGIGTNRVGRVMRGGRTEEFFDTSYAISGQRLYVSATVRGGLTNVAPTAPNIEQQVGTCHISSTNGYMNVYLWTPSTLGGLTADKYVTYTNPVFSSDSFSLTNSGTAKISAVSVPAGTTNIYTLPAVGGQLAVYTDIQMVPVSAVVGESGGVAKGRVVYQAGVSGGRPLVKYADRRYNTTLPIIGVAAESGVTDAIIEVISFGPIDNMDTSTFSPNDLMYLGTNGMLAPASSTFSDAMILVGTCMTSNSTTGSMLVNIRSYYMDGAFSGSMRYTVKNDSSVTNATANFFAINEANEAMRMGIRSTNHFNGQGSYLVSGANGRMVYGNLRQKGFVWNIDMTDSGDIYNHNNWPMMSLVPQANSNAFLGIGTTNPLAKLHVTGSAIASNLFRLATGVYSNTELITYGDATNLNGIMNTNLQTQINNATNNSEIAKTNLQTQIDTTTSRVFTIESRTSVWNKASTDAVSATSRVAAVEGRTSVWNQASVDASSSTNWMASHTNAVEELLTPKRFKANVGTTNITYGTGPAIIPFTNIVLSASGGSIYSNALGVCQWWPKATNGVVKLMGSYGSAFANNKLINVSIYKNGAFYSTVYDLAATAQAPGNILGFTWNFVDTVTPTVNDYYQIYLQETTGYLTRQAGTNNWWYGEVSP